MYQREAPVRRMTPTSARRVNAEIWIVLEISSSAARAWISAITKVALRNPSKARNSCRRYSPWSVTRSTPGRPVNALAMEGNRAGSDS